MTVEALLIWLIIGAVVLLVLIGLVRRA